MLVSLLVKYISVICELIVTLRIGLFSWQKVSTIIITIPQDTKDTWFLNFVLLSLVWKEDYMQSCMQQQSVFCMWLSHVIIMFPSSIVSGSGQI